MSKRKRLEILAKFIGLEAAHQIIIWLTGKPESIKRMKKEVEHYDDLSSELASGSWSSSDVLKIKELACVKCRKKLEGYSDLGSGKFRDIELIVDEIVKSLGIE